MHVNIDVEYFRTTGYRSVVDTPELIIDTSAAGIATFVLNRPAELNAWTYPLEKSFFAALDSAAGDPEVRVVVVTGAGRGFCAGASMQLLGGGDRSERPDRAQRRRLCELAEFPKPVIAAVNGPAAGLGFALAISCDIRFVAADAKLTTSFARLGLVAEHGVAWLLPRLVGGARARDLLLSGRTMTGAEAESTGWCIARSRVQVPSRRRWPMPGCWSRADAQQAGRPSSVSCSTPITRPCCCLCGPKHHGPFGIIKVLLPERAVVSRLRQPLPAQAGRADPGRDRAA